MTRQAAFRHVRVTTVTVGKKNKYYIFRVCVCGISYPVRNAHALYYIASGGFSACHIFLHYLTNWTIFRNKKGLL